MKLLEEFRDRRGLSMFGKMIWNGGNYTEFLCISNSINGMAGSNFQRTLQDLAHSTGILGPLVRPAGDLLPSKVLRGRHNETRLV